MIATACLVALLARSDAVTIDADPAARQPQVAVDARGGVFVVYGVGAEVRCAASRDGGRTFAAPVAVGTVPNLALGMRRGPRVAAADGVVVVAAIGGRQGGGKDGDVFAWRSTDAGATWAGPVRVNTVPAAAREGLHALAARPDGLVFCAWNDLREGDGMTLYGARSADGGATWEPDRLVYRSPDRTICPCCHPSAVFAPDGTLLVMWRNVLAGDRDMYLARSADGGRTFGAVEKLGRGAWAIDYCPMDGGAVAVAPAGAITTVWMRAQEVFVARPGEPERKLGAGIQPWAAAGPGGVHVAWLRARPGALMLARPGADPTVLADAANDPVVAAGPGGRGPVVAAWERTAEPRSLALQVLAPAAADGAAPAPGGE